MATEFNPLSLLQQEQQQTTSANQEDNGDVDQVPVVPPRRTTVASILDDEEELDMRMGNPTTRRSSRGSDLSSGGETLDDGEFQTALQFSNMENHQVIWANHDEWLQRVTGDKFTVAIKDPACDPASLLHPNPPIRYLVLTQPNRYTVRRRYSDFVWLRGVLKSRYTGILIPPLPEKRALGNKSRSFLIHRMRGLGLFMDNILANPYLKSDASTVAFLSVSQTEVWDSVKRATPAHDGNNEAEIRWRAVLEKYAIPADAEERLSAHQEKIKALHSLMLQMVRATHKVVDAASQYSMTLHDMKSSYENAITMHLSGLPSDKPTREVVHMLRNLGGAVGSWAEIVSQKPTIIKQLLYEVLKYEAAYIRELDKLISLRRKRIQRHNEACKHMRKAMADLENASTQGNNTSYVEKLQAKADEQRRLVKLASNSASAITKGLFLLEIDGFAKHRVGRLSEMVGVLAAGYLSFVTQLGRMWQGVLDGMDFDWKEMTRLYKLRIGDENMDVQ